MELQEQAKLSPAAPQKLLASCDGANQPRLCRRPWHPAQSPYVPSADKAPLAIDPWAAVRSRGPVLTAVGAAVTCSGASEEHDAVIWMLSTVRRRASTRERRADMRRRTRGKGSVGLRFVVAPSLAYLDVQQAPPLVSSNAGSATSSAGHQTWTGPQHPRPTALPPPPATDEPLASLPRIICRSINLLNALVPSEASCV